MKLVALETFKARYFEKAPGERAMRRQLKKWAEEGHARKVAGTWYVDEHWWLANGNPLVEKALAG